MCEKCFKISLLKHQKWTKIEHLSEFHRNSSFIFFFSANKLHIWVFISFSTQKIILFFKFKMLFLWSRRKNNIKLEKDERNGLSSLVDLNNLLKHFSKKHRNITQRKYVLIMTFIIYTYKSITLFWFFWRLCRLI